MILNPIVLDAKNLERVGRFMRPWGCRSCANMMAAAQSIWPLRRGGEICPCAEGRETLSLRIGFRVVDVAVVLRLAIEQGAAVVTPLKDGQREFRAVISDPERHVVELATGTQH